MFGDVVRANRQRMGLSQEELAERSGVSVRGLRKIESSRTDRPRLATVRLLADAFAMTGEDHDRFVEAALGAAGAARPSASRPSQLPLDVSMFTGRTAEMRRLDSASPATALWVISGTAGVGKTSLAVHWGHRARDRFPDGQLHVNLRGYDPEQPMTTGNALAELLIGIGLTGAEIPVRPEERVARYRTETAGRRMLIVLDNASSVEQVRSLLPGAGPGTVLVTSRDSLAGLVVLHGAQRLELDLLPTADAEELLRRLIGTRAEEERDATRLLADQCVNLPLALRIVAERAVAQSTTRLSRISTELAGKQRLAMLDAGDDPRSALPTVFSWSVEHLPTSAAHTFELLGLHPGPDIDTVATAALAGTAPAEARRDLDLLTRSHLVHRTGDDRFGMHDLLRAYAGSLAAAHLAPAEARTAQTRLFDYYLRSVTAANDLRSPADASLRPACDPLSGPVAALHDLDQAGDWLDAELSVITAVTAHAVAHGWPAHAVRFAATLQRYLNGCHPAAALTIHGYAVTAARQTGDALGEGQALYGLGAAYMQDGRHHEAAANLEGAIRAFTVAGDRRGHARALTSLGIVVQRRGEHHLSATHLRTARRLSREAGDPIGEARALSNLGVAHGRMGDHDLAATHLRQARDLAQAAGDRVGEASALNNLAAVEAHIGQYALAVCHLTHALEVTRRVGDRRCEASVLDSLGAVYVQQGEHGRAKPCFEAALALFRALDDRYGQTCALNGLGEVALATGSAEDAIGFHASAMDVAVQRGWRLQQVRAYQGMGAAHDVLGQPLLSRENRARAGRIQAELGAGDPAQERVETRTRRAVAVG